MTEGLYQARPNENLFLEKKEAGSKHPLRAISVIAGLSILFFAAAVAAYMINSSVTMPTWFKEGIELAQTTLGTPLFATFLGGGFLLGVTFVGLGLYKKKNIEVIRNETEKSLHCSNLEMCIRHAHLEPRYFNVTEINGVLKVEQASAFSVFLRTISPFRRDFSDPLTKAVKASVLYFNEHQNFEDLEPKWQILAAKYNHYLGTVAFFQNKGLPRIDINERDKVDFVHSNVSEKSYETKPFLRNGKWYYMKNQANHGLEAAFIFAETQFKRLMRMLTFGAFFQYMTESEKSEAYDLEQPELDPEIATVQNIGHATLLFQYNGLNILTDPVFGDLNPLLYPRKTKPGLLPEELPVIDVILISHNHRDHCDVASLKKLVAHQPVLLVPEGDKKLFEGLGFKQVHTHGWWQKTTLRRGGKETHFYSLPCYHWSGRGPFDAHKSLTCSWAFKAEEGRQAVYFRGDTANLPEKAMEEIRDFVEAPITVNFEPGGPNHTRRWMQSTHQSVLDSLISQFDVADEKTTVTTYLMHHNAYELGTDRFDEAVKIKDQLLEFLEHHLEDPNGQRAAKSFQKLPAFVRKELREGKLAKIEKIGVRKFIDHTRTYFYSPKIGQQFPLFLRD